MNEREPFLTRWSRRKRDAAEGAVDASQSPPSVDALAGEHDEERIEPPKQAATEGENPPAIDLSTLPALESITAETDIRAFLAPGVPAELTRAALRRAWSADPTIRDFIGLVENGWDFNAPDGVPGFGPLQMTDEMRRLVMDMIGGSNSPAKAETVTAVTGLEQPLSCAEESGSVKTAAKTSEMVLDSGHGKNLPGRGQDESKTGPEEAVDAMQQKDIATQYSRDQSHLPKSSIRRGHGRALPE